MGVGLGAGVRFCFLMAWAAAGVSQNTGVGGWLAGWF